MSARNPMHRCWVFMHYMYDSQAPLGPQWARTQEHTEYFYHDYTVHLIVAVGSIVTKWLANRFLQILALNDQ